MKTTLFTLFCAGCFSLTALANQSKAVTQTERPAKTWRYRVALADKKNCGYTIKHPEAFLSTASIQRRRRLGLKVDQHDLPLTPSYLQQLREVGMKICYQSKWNNTVVVETADTTQMRKVRHFPFVNSTRLVWQSPDSLLVQAMPTDRQTLVTNQRDTLANYYGHAATQVEMLQVQKLHQSGFRGKGVTIAVIDGGFFNADLIDGLKHARILGTRNFVRPTTSVYEEQSHGMSVLSCMAANAPYSLVGTAPEASYYLLQSEDWESEQLIEEDVWCAAVEYADSIGCDIVTSSLGYMLFDHPEMSHKYYEQDGQTALNSRSASLAASRGILLFNSAGNSADEQWKKIGFPADATNMITVGAVNADRLNTVFSSIGNTADGRVKPDLMAQGGAAAVYRIDGSVGRVNGTSFSCPILCGAVACIVGAFPHRRPEEIIRALQQSGDNATHPDNIFGYGIPNLYRAFSILKQL